MISKKLLEHELQTPTLALTVIGLAALMIHVARSAEHTDVVAFVALGFAGGGVAMALGAEVERHGEEWGWRGLIRSLRSPSRIFWVHLLSHLPQLLTAAIIALHWRHRKRNHHAQK